MLCLENSLLSELNENSIQWITAYSLLRCNDSFKTVQNQKRVSVVRKWVRVRQFIILTLNKYITLTDLSFLGYSVTVYQPRELAQEHCPLDRRLYFPSEGSGATDFYRP
jgi:hypothetical protein